MANLIAGGDGLRRRAHRQWRRSQTPEHLPPPLPSSTSSGPAVHRAEHAFKDWPKQEQAYQHCPSTFRTRHIEAQWKLSSTLETNPCVVSPEAQRMPSVQALPLTPELVRLRPCDQTQHWASRKPLGGSLAPVHDSSNDPRQSKRRRPRPVRMSSISAQGVSSQVHLPLHPVHEPLPHSQNTNCTAAAYAAEPGKPSLWVCIHQSQPGEEAYVYLHSCPLSEEAWQSLPDQEKPELMITIRDSVSFQGCKVIRGLWHNFHISWDGNVRPVVSEFIMFPNEVHLLGQAQHSCTHFQQQQQLAEMDQRMEDATDVNCSWDCDVQFPASCALDSWGNDLVEGSWSWSQQGAGQAQGDDGEGTQGGRVHVVRSKRDYQDLMDVVWWLCDPSHERVMSHLANIIRSLNEQGIALHPERVYSRLCCHWGREPLLGLGLTRSKVLWLLEHQEEWSASAYPRSIPLPCAQNHYRAELDASLHTFRQEEFVDVSNISETSVIARHVVDKPVSREVRPVRRAEGMQRAASVQWRSVSPEAAPAPQAPSKAALLLSTVARPVSFALAVASSERHVGATIQESRTPVLPATITATLATPAPAATAPKQQGRVRTRRKSWAPAKAPQQSQARASAGPVLLGSSDVGFFASVDDAPMMILPAVPTTQPKLRQRAKTPAVTGKARSTAQFATVV